MAKYQYLIAYLYADNNNRLSCGKTIYKTSKTKLNCDELEIAEKKIYDDIGYAPTIINVVALPVIGIIPVADSSNENEDKDEKPYVEIFTDGACLGNPGPGGWGVILRCKDKKNKSREKELSGYVEHTTNNRMELTAVIEGLRELKKPSIVVVTTDSQYVCDAINKGWVHKWKLNGWMRNKKDAVLNPDLWKELLELLNKHEVEFRWVKGHAGHPENERCDKLASEAIYRRKG